MIKQAPEVIAMYPDFVERDSAYELLADAYVAKGDKACRDEGAAAVLRRRRPESRDTEEARHTAGGSRQTDRRNQDARTADLHLSHGGRTAPPARGSLSGAECAPDGAIREYTAVIAAESRRIRPRPTSTLPARCKAQNVLDDAKEHLLLALEAAPGFKPAQKLLLELSR